MKAKVFRLDEIPERFWTKSSDYPHAEVCSSYYDYITIDPHVFQGFEKADNRVCVRSASREYLKCREMLCFSLGDYLYLIRANKGKNCGSSILWRVKWSIVDIVDSGAIEIRGPEEDGDPE